MGRFRLYVNERNVVTDPFLGAIDSLEKHIKQYTIDVSRFLEGRETTIAVWYAPTSKRRSDKQLSLEFYGKDQRGKPFYAQADGSWFCKEASSATLGPGQEAINATQYDKLWHSTELKEKDWLRPMDSADTLTLPLQDTSPLYQGIRMSHVLSAVDEVADSTGVTFDFGRPFRGWVRITLRGAKKGERLCFGEHSYICGGQMDEQAFPRFTINGHNLSFFNLIIAHLSPVLFKLQLRMILEVPPKAIWNDISFVILNTDGGIISVNIGKIGATILGFYSFRPRKDLIADECLDSIFNICIGVQFSVGACSHNSLGQLRDRF